MTDGLRQRVPAARLGGNHAREEDFLRGGGEMGELIRAYDWASTSLGPPAAWPQTLKTSVRLMLSTRHPVFIWWGDDLIQFYNDAYRQTMGPELHPCALGQGGRECWAEIWDIIGPQIEYVMAGKGATWQEEQLVPTTRHGRREDVWWTYGYSPIDDDTRPNGVGGVLVLCHDVTHRRTDARLIETQRRLNAVLNNASVSIILMDDRQQCVYMNAAAEKMTGYSLAEAQGRPLHDVVHHTRPDGSHYPLDECPIDRAFPEDNQMQGEEVFVHKDGSFYPVAFTASPIRDAEANTIGTIVEVREISAEKKAQEHQRILINELNHRVKNTLATVQSLAAQSFRGISTEDQPSIKAFEERLFALARAHDVLTRENWEKAELGEIIEEVLDPYRRLGSRFEINGSAIGLPPGTALALAMAVHELATNAAKYGALSGPAGKIAISWRITPGDPPHLALRWQERDGPAVAPPSRKGFGTRLIERMLANELSGEVVLAFEPTGVVCSVRAPLEGATFLQPRREGTARLMACGCRTTLCGCLST